MRSVHTQTHGDGDNGDNGDPDDDDDDDETGQGRGDDRRNGKAGVSQQTVCCPRSLQIMLRFAAFSPLEPLKTAGGSA